MCFYPSADNWHSVRYILLTLCSSPETLMFKKAVMLEQAEVSYLVRELRQLKALSQEQFAAV